MNKQIDEMAKALRYAVNEKHGYISMRGLAEALHNAGIRKQNEWIPVTERLPKDDELVLVVVAGDVDIGFYVNKCARWYNQATSCYKDEITHWMPLPEPPERSDSK